MTEEQETAIARTLFYLLIQAPDYGQRDNKHIAVSRMASAFPMLIDERMEEKEEN